MLTKRRVMLTGCGIASPLGNDLDTYCRRLYQGHYGIGKITQFDTSTHPTKLGACLDPIPAPVSLTETEKKFSSNLSILSLFCAEQAIFDSKLDLSQEDTNRMGVIIGSGHLNLYDLEPTYDMFFNQGLVKVSPLTIPLNMANAPANRISMKYGLKGFANTVTTACSSGFTALIDSYRLIRDGYQDVMITGGIDLVLCETVVTVWERMRILSKEREKPALACRPFDRDRRGIVLGDGAAFFVLEEYERAVQRGANLLGEVKGAFQNSDSFDLVKPDSEGETFCMQAVLKTAGLKAEDIDMIYAHGTGTRLNDTTEYQSLFTVFKERLKDIPVCAIKAMIGHTMGASGPMSLAAALGTLKSGNCYPIPNLGHLEEGIDLLITTEGKKMSNVDNVLINTFAFGGTNACLIISRI